MDSKFIYFCAMIIFFSSLNGQFKEDTSSHPEWFRKFKEEYNSNKKMSEKWCEMFKLVPQEVQKEILVKLTQEKVGLLIRVKECTEINLKCPLFNETIEEYTTKALKEGMSLTLSNCKKMMQCSLEKLLPHQVCFVDIFNDRSFTLMLAELQNISRKRLYAGWHVDQCIQCVKKACDTSESKC